jgi:hypothetical protein
MKWAGHVASLGEMRHAYKILVEKPEEEIPLGRRRCRRKNNIRTGLKEIGWERVGWIHLA